MIRIPLNIQKFADGKVVIDTELDKKGFESGLNKISGIAKSGFKGVAASIGVATAAVTGLIATSVKAYGEFEQLQGGAQKIFDEMDYSKIEKDANEAYKTMNLSASQYLDMINSVGATFAATMGDEKGYDTAKKGMQALADYASGTGKDINLLNDKYKAISRSTTSYLSIADQFSGILPQTTKGFLEQAQASGYLSDEYTELSQVPVQEYQEALTSMLEDGVGKMGLLGNTVAESEETITGSFNTMKSSWSNFIVALSSGKDMTDVIDKLIDSAATFVKNIIPVVETAISSIADVLPDLVEKLVSTLPGLLEKTLPSLINAAVKLFQGLVNALPQLMPILINGVINIFTEIVKILPQINQSLIDGVLLIINEIAKQLPTLIPLIIDTMLKMYESVIDNIDLFIDAAIELIIGLTEGLIQALPILIEKIPVIIEKLVTKLTDPEMLGKLVQAAARLIIELAIGLVKAIPGLLVSVGKVGMAIIKGLSNLNTAVKEIGKNIVRGIWSGLSNSLGWIKSKISGWVGNVLKFIKKLFGIHSPSTVMRDEVGKYLAQGMGVGFEDELDNVYKDMQKSINFENAKIQASVESGNILNTIMNSTPVQINIDADVDMDGQKVGRMITPTISRTIKTGGGY
jgi:phage-related protein